MGVVKGWDAISDHEDDVDDGGKSSISVLEYDVSIPVGMHRTCDGK